MKTNEKQFDNFWTDNETEHLSFQLSETRPIRAITYRWPNNNSSWNDMHYSVELGILLSGKMSRYYRDAQIDLVPGNIWFSNMWEPHGFKIIKAPCEIVFFEIFPPMLARMHFEESSEINWLAPFYTSPHDRPQVATPEKKRRILSIGKELKQISRCPEKMPLVWLRLKLLEVLLLVNDQWQHIRTSNKSPGHSFDKISKAIQMVFESKKGITTQQAARECGINRNAFSSLFLRTMGIRYSKFSMLYRLSAVAEDLRKTSTPIKAIAAQWGFTDVCHMHHCFKKDYRYSPFEYRKKFS